MANVGTFPTTHGFRTVNFSQKTATQTTRTVSGRSVRTSNSTTLWEGTLVFPPLSVADWRPIQAFIALTQGALHEFDITIPVISESQSVNKASLIAYVDNDSASANLAGDTSININTNLSGTNALKAGDVVRFANHTKVYMVTTDINTDASGNATLNIQPALVENLTQGEAITTNNVPFRMHIKNDVQEFQYRTDGYVNYEIDVEEVL